MILALGASGREFDSRSGPNLKVKIINSQQFKKKLIDYKSIAIVLRGFESHLSCWAKYARGQSRMFNVDSIIVGVRYF